MFCCQVQQQVTNILVAPENISWLRPCMGVPVKLPLKTDKMNDKVHKQQLQHGVSYNVCGCMYKFQGTLFSYTGLG